MEREKIKALLASTNPDDVMIGITFLRGYTFKDLRELLPNIENYNVRRQTFSSVFNTEMAKSPKFYKLHHSLFITIYRRAAYVHTREIKSSSKYDLL